MYREQVGAESAGRTVLEHLCSTRHHSSGEVWVRRVERGEVEVDGRRATCSTILQAGQTIVWRRPPWNEPEVPTNYRIIHEDDSIVAVDKPSGLPTMPAGGFLNHTLLAMIRSLRSEEHTSELQSQSNLVCRLLLEKKN